MSEYKMENYVEGLGAIKIEKYIDEHDASELVKYRILASQL